MDTENKNRKSGIKTAIFYITENGSKLAQRLKGLYIEALILKYGSNVVPEIWSECKNIVFIMATGIVVRTVAPLIKDKKTDPTVVVLDEKGKYAISLLGGHLGGANDSAREIADFLGGEAVITTASDTNNMPSIDLWARDNDLTLEDWEIVPIEKVSMERPILGFKPKVNEPVVSPVVTEAPVAPIITEIKTPELEKSKKTKENQVFSKIESEVTDSELISLLSQYAPTSLEAKALKEEIKRRQK